MIRRGSFGKRSILAAALAVAALLAAGGAGGAEITPAFTPPTYTPPTYTPPTFTTRQPDLPSYTPPKYTPPTYDNPTYRPPTYIPPTITAPKYTPPTFTMPAYTPPLQANADQPFYRPPAAPVLLPPAGGGEAWTGSYFQRGAYHRLARFDRPDVNPFARECVRQGFPVTGERSADGFFEFVVYSRLAPVAVGVDYHTPGSVARVGYYTHAGGRDTLAADFVAWLGIYSTQAPGDRERKAP